MENQPAATYGQANKLGVTLRSSKLAKSSRSPLALSSQTPYRPGDPYKPSVVRSSRSKTNTHSDDPSPAPPPIFGNRLSSKQSTRRLKNTSHNSVTEESSKTYSASVHDQSLSKLMLVIVVALIIFNFIFTIHVIKVRAVAYKQIVAEQNDRTN